LWKILGRLIHFTCTRKSTGSSVSGPGNGQTRTKGRKEIGRNGKGMKEKYGTGRIVQFSSEEILYTPTITVAY